MSSPYLILSLKKALQIIEYLADQPGQCRLQDIAQAVEIPRSTALRLLHTLQAYNYVGQDPENKRYYLTLKFLNIGSKVRSSFSLDRVALPFLKPLSVALGGSVNLAVAQNFDVFIIDVVVSVMEPIEITTQAGRLVPMYCSGLGKAILAHYNEEQLEKYLQEMPLNAYTPLTITSREALLVELETVRQNGYAFDRGEFRHGICGIAAPIFDSSGNVVASISWAELASVLTEEIIESKSALIKQAAADISNQL